LNSLELVFKGTRISPGLASDTVWVSGDILDCGAEAYRIELDQVEADMERIRRAFGQVEAELEKAAQRLSEEIDPGLAEIFRAHHLMLENLLSSNEFERELRGSLVGAAEAVKNPDTTGTRFPCAEYFPSADPNNEGVNQIHQCERPRQPR